MKKIEKMEDLYVIPQNLFSITEKEFEEHDLITKGYRCTFLGFNDKGILVYWGYSTLGGSPVTTDDFSNGFQTFMCLAIHKKNPKEVILAGHSSPIKIRR